jgi:hypothetical protein
VNDRCLLCEKEWEQGDLAVAIGVIKRDRSASLQFAHRDCIARNVLGDEPFERLQLLIARERE